jgi:ATP phosphoribosyltransferase regulatory subunit HisZ
LLAIEPIVLSLGNVAVFDALIAQEALNDEQASALRQIFVKQILNQMKTLLPLLDARTMHLNHCNDRLVLSTFGYQIHRIYNKNIDPFSMK